MYDFNDMRFFGNTKFDKNFVKTSFKLKYNKELEKDFFKYSIDWNTFYDGEKVQCGSNTIVQLQENGIAAFVIDLKGFKHNYLFPFETIPKTAPRVDCSMVSSESHLTSKYDLSDEVGRRMYVNDMIAKEKLNSHVF